MCRGLALWSVILMTYCDAALTFPGTKRLECVELARAFGAGTPNDSASKLGAPNTSRYRNADLP